MKNDIIIVRNKLRIAADNIHEALCPDPVNIEQIFKYLKSYYVIYIILLNWIKLL